MTASPETQYLAPYLALASAAVWVAMLLWFLFSNRREIRSGIVKLASWYFIVPCIALAILAAAGAAYGLGLRAVAAPSDKEATNQYVRLESLTGGVFGPVQVELTSTGTFERLRIYLEFAPSKSSMLDPLEWGTPDTVLVGDWRDVAPDIRKKFTIVYPEAIQNSGPESRFQYYWGNPEIKSDRQTLISRAKNKARLRILASDTKPQEFPLLVMMVAFDNQNVVRTGHPVISVINSAEAESFLDWKKR